MADKLDFDSLASLEALARIDRAAEDRLWQIVANHLRGNRKTEGAYQATLAELYRKWRGIVKNRRGDYVDSLYPLPLSYCFADLSLRKDKRDETGKRRKPIVSLSDALPSQLAGIADKRASEAETARARLSDAIDRASLSELESAVLSAYLRGERQTTIAAIVGRSQASVSDYLSEIFSKLAKNL